MSFGSSFQAAGARLLAVLFSLLALQACSPRINILGGGLDEPLKERVLSGDSRDKIVVIPVRGVISASPGRTLLGQKPSLVQQVGARLNKAARDSRVKAVVLAIDSPGGSVTASDILHRLVIEHKRKTGQKVAACLLGVAASGGYYVAAAADRIVAHPTTVTGSVGVIFIRPQVSGLMEKIGVKAEVTKSGRLKDMGSPFRDSTSEERELIQAVVDENVRRFIEVVKQGRGLSERELEPVADARILTAGQALAAGLVDRIGYMEDALAVARELAGLPEDCKVAVYRRRELADDTLYNTVYSMSHMEQPALIDAGIPKLSAPLEAGFYYLWAPGIAE